MKINLFKSRFICFLLFLLAATSSKAQPINWGVNGHPLTQQDYNAQTWDDQIKYLKDLNVNIYRLDVRVDNSGVAQKESSFISILKKLKENGIDPMATIIPAKLNSSVANNYDESYQQGKEFCKRYGDYLNVIEVGNEEDNATMLNNGSDGSKKMHYDTARLNNILVKVKGFIDGAKSIKPLLKVSLSFSWVHFGYLDLLEDNNVKYDIIGLHWYSNMGDPSNVKPPFGNVLKRIAANYRKPVWITELNYWRGTENADFQKQSEYLTKTIQTIISQKVVTGIFLYELYDEPALRSKKSSESYYGLLYTDPSGNRVAKDVYNSYKAIIQNNK